MEGVIQVYYEAPLNGGGHRTITKTRILRIVPLQSHGDDPRVMVMPPSLIP
jgi:hypothetical protein